MTETREADTEYRSISPRELALLVAMHRRGFGWAQETLAEISGLTARTIQRVENAEPSSADTRGALARAFKIEDIDIFNKPHAFSSAEKMRKEAEELNRNNLTLAVNVAKSGKELADLGDTTTMYCFQLPDGVSEGVVSNVASIFDYLRYYGDAREDYSFADKLKVHMTLDEYLAELSKQGFALCCAHRKTKIVGKNWVDKTPLPWSITYIFVTKNGEEPKYVVVSKALNMG